MPYEVGSDTLPENVKKMSKPEQEKWVATYNSAFAKCTADKGKDCEGNAFAIANGNTNKEDEVATEETVIEETATPEPDTESKLSRIVSGFVDAIKKLFTGSEPIEIPPEEDVIEEDKNKMKGSFKILKAKDGTMRWMGIPSNKWRDRDQPAQIIEEKAHKDFVEYLNKTKDYPVLLSWHTPGTRIGIADFVDYSNGFLLMGGPIDKDKQVEADILALKCQTEEIGMSHGFVYTYSDPKKEIIGSYKTWEVSHLPVSKAANVWTSIDILKEKLTKEVNIKMLSPEKKKYLAEIHGESFVTDIETKIASLEKDLLAAGVEYKDFTPVAVVDTKQIVADAVKALSEDASYKELFAISKVMAETIKQINDTVIPTLYKRVEAAEKIAKDADTKAQKSIDDIIADAYKAKGGFRPSKDGEQLSKEEQAKDKTHEIKAFEPGMAQGIHSMLGTSPVDK